jgi:ATP-dependent DNA helicase PIF1
VGGLPSSLAIEIKLDSSHWVIIIDPMNKLADDQNLVFDAVRTGRFGKVIVMSGPAGCGKSEIVNEIKKHVGLVLLVAPTGQAASIIGGRTIHRAFGQPTVAPINPNFKECPLRDQRWMDPATKFFGGKQLSAIKAAHWVIFDEWSMVRCDLLDGVDEAMQKIRGSTLPFGGCGVLLCGDGGQAIPVAKDNDVAILESYGYSFPFGIHQSRVLARANPHNIELTKIWRQSDESEARLLTRIRSGKQTDMDLARINERVGEPAHRSVILSPYNEVVHHFNEEALARQSGRRYRFVSSKGGTMKNKAGPLPDQITLAEGCRVIIKSNFTDRDGVEAVNGDVGVFLGLEGHRLLVQLDRNNHTVQVSPRSTPEVVWDVGSDEDGTLQIVTRPTGKFIQYPICLGYAMSTHASQGSTMERLHLYLPFTKPFARSLVYVGLSRIKSFSGLTLNRPIKHSDIWSSIEEPKVFLEAKSPIIPLQELLFKI